MATPTMRTRLFTDESMSLRSFRANTQPLPLKASSLKLPRSSSFTTELNRRVQEPTLQDLILSHQSNTSEDIILFGMGLPSTSSLVAETPMNTAPNVRAEQTTPHNSWSKPRTIIRRLTTKFNPRLYTSSPVVSRLTTIPSGPNAFTKESRDAALRERGLLPPLRANKDLSAQEQEQDKAIPILSPKDDPQGSTEANTLSAADLIKKEWEAKNRSLESAQLQRMNSFKFGGMSSATDSPVIPKGSSSEPDSVVPDVQALPADVAYSPPSSLTDPLVPLGTVPGSRPVTPLLDISPEIVAYLFPFPPSTPRSVSRKLDLSPSPSPTSVPLPPSPGSRVFDTTSLRSASGAQTPGPLNREASLPPTPTPPIIAFTPCAAISPELVSADDAINPSLHKLTDLSVPLEESASSIQTPSLDSNSHTTTTDSTLGTSESVVISGKGRLGGLKITTHERSNYNIPVIVESPIEDSLEEQFVVVGPTSTNQAAPITAPITGSEPLSSPRIKKRVLTDPTNGNLNRKKSIIPNPFKRAGHEDHSTTVPDERPRRLSIKTSLSNMHRSVAGTLSRKSVSPDGRRKMFDASHLPPSPIFPLSFRSLHSPSSPTAPGFRTEGEVRRAVSPTVYSQGHILMEASHIEDEESRRVTEMAFLT